MIVQEALLNVLICLSIAQRRLWKFKNASKPAQTYSYNSFQNGGHKLLFCLHVNEPSWPRQHVQKKQKNFEVKMRQRGLINTQIKE